VDWPALGRMTGTLVILMGIERIGAIAAALLAHGRDPQTPVAVIQEGTMPGERRLQTTLALIEDAVAEAGIRPPAIVVVGPVVGLT
jgi:uroporphyrin-III C-methyltransferase/precorrin-2 dehydrogenase/sirohydrochlorin ferrochelatase